MSDTPYIIYDRSIQRLLQNNPLCQLVAEKPLQIKNQAYKMQLLSLGDAPADSPTVIFVAGIHGIESIGVDILLNYLNALTHQYSWSPSIRSLLNRVRLLVLPMANPSGIALSRRANGHGVDLMRNAPMDAKDKATWLVGGHRYSPILPWYRGKIGALEAESATLFEWCNTHFCSGPCTIVIDIHSGFGTHDQIWYPYAGQKAPFPNIHEVQSLKVLFDKSYPNHHHYVFSQQSEHYVTHGDLWDWMYDHQLAQAPKVFLPLTLELGSWLWLKKNPRQLLNRTGFFHPIVAHRRSRVLRQHFSLFDFIIKALEVWPDWTQRVNPEERSK